MRRDDFDFIKGVLIVLVVWGHCCMYNSGPDYDKNILTAYVRLFQMPLFIFISGYFQKSINDIAQLKGKMLKVIFTIIVPILSFYALSVVLKALFAFFSQKDDMVLADMFKGHISILWYLICLLLCLLLYSPVNLVISNKGKVGITILLLSPLLVMLIPSNVCNFQFLWLFFVLGVLFRRYEEKIRITLRLHAKYATFIMYAFSLFFLVTGYFFPTNYTFYNLENNYYILQGWGHYLNDLVFSMLLLLLRYVIYIVASVCAFVYLMTIYKIVSENTKRFVCNIGKHTLTIYVMHLMILVDVLKPFMKGVNGTGVVYGYSPEIKYYLISVVETIALVVITYHFSIFIKKHRVTNFLFMGGR